MKSPIEADPWAVLRRFTPARIAQLREQLRAAS